jgi:23S rRNA (adenine2503-C2)-methyltransferase
MNKCRHCATGRIEYIRDLSSEEIVKQAIMMLKDQEFAGGRVKVLFMGMGEPLLNYENVMEAVRIFTREPWLDNVHNIIVSTSGIVPAIRVLTKEKIRPKLAITIGSVSEKKRSWLLVPVGKLYSLSALLEVSREYVAVTGDSVIFQYPMIKDFNDSLDDAETLTNLVKDIPCEVHIIPFNEFKGSQLRRPTQETLFNFCQFLSSHGVKVFLKPSFGVDINAGCGQLVAGYSNRNYCHK